MRQSRKLSAVLDAFAAPLLTEALAANDIDAIRAIYRLAVEAWNLALQPPRERPRLIAQLLKDFPQAAHPHMRALLAEMIERKERHFTADLRIIAAWQLMETPREYRLRVAYVLAPTPPPWAPVREVA
jgi:hypothetical protein